MKYIAILDYQKLDNGMFMKSFAEAMGNQKGCSGIIIHGDSAYTDRLIQTGMFREDAVLRSTRDLNHRIIALLADHGVAGIGVNGYQREIARVGNARVTVDRNWLESRPPGTHIILSNLAWDHIQEKIVPVPLSLLAEEIAKQPDRTSVIFFSHNDRNDSVIVRHERCRNESDARGHLAEELPGDLDNLSGNCFSATTEAFGKLPDDSALIRFSSG